MSNPQRSRGAGSPPGSNLLALLVTILPSCSGHCGPVLGFSTAAEQKFVSHLCKLPPSDGLPIFTVSNDDNRPCPMTVESRLCCFYFRCHWKTLPVSEKLNTATELPEWEESRFFLGNYHPLLLLADHFLHYVCSFYHNRFLLSFAFLLHCLCSFSEKQQTLSEGRIRLKLTIQSPRLWICPLCGPLFSNWWRWTFFDSSDIPTPDW